MIITDRMRSDIEALVKRGLSKKIILNQLLLNYSPVRYGEKPQEYIANSKDISHEIDRQRSKK